MKVVYGIIKFASRLKLSSVTKCDRDGLSPISQLSVSVKCKAISPNPKITRTHGGLHHLACFT